MLATSTTTMKIWLVPPLLLAGCLEDAWNDWQSLGTGEAPSTGIASSTTGFPGVEPTGGEIQTVTSAAETTEPGPAATSAGPDLPGNEAPTIDSFSVAPEHLSEAGPALLQLSASADAVKIRLALNGDTLAELTPGDFPYAYDVLSAKHNFDHNFEAVAVDAEGLESAPATAMLTVTVPASGAEKCLFDKDKDDAGVLFSTISALEYADDAIVAVGTRDVGVGPRLAVWKLDRDHCEEVLPGWPKTLANWSVVPDLPKKVSGGTAVARDEDGNLVVAGFTLVDLKPVRYLAMLNPDGALLWEDEGQVGEEIAGLAIAPKPQAAVFAGGWRRSSDVPIRTDAAIWRYLLDGTAHTPDYLAAPFTENEFDADEFNDRSERIRAVLFEPLTGLAVAVGDRDIRLAGNVIYNRSFLIRVHPLAGPVGDAWTSLGDAFLHDAALAVDLCGDELVAAGWRRDSPNDDPQPVLHWFDRDGTSTELQPIPAPVTEFSGVACDREGKVVSAGVRDLGQPDARVGMTPRSGGTPTWYEVGGPGHDEAADASCDGRGFCAWGGVRTAAGKRHAVVRVHHP